MVKIFGVFRVPLICSVITITSKIKRTLSSWKKACLWYSFRQHYSGDLCDLSTNKKQHNKNWQTPNFGFWPHNLGISWYHLNWAWYKHFVYTFKFVKLFAIEIYQNYIREKTDTDPCYPYWPTCVYVSFYERQWTRLVHPESLKHTTCHGIFSEFWTNKAALYPCRKYIVHAEECVTSSRNKIANLPIKLIRVLFAIVLCHRTWLSWASDDPLRLR